MSRSLVCNRRIVWTASAALLAVILPYSSMAQEVTQLPGRDRSMSVEEEVLWSVGSVGDSDSEAFSRVRSVAFGPDGSLYVLDQDNARVLVFEADGSYRRTIGREGEGPGEFRLPSVLAVDGDARLWVGDAMSRSVSLFGPDGSLERTLPYRSRGGPDPSTLTVARGGLAFLIGRKRGAVDGQVPVFALAADGSEAQLIHMANLVGIEEMQRTQTGFRRVSPPIFSPVIRIAALSDGSVALVDGVAYEVKILDSTGVRLVVQRDIEPRTVTEADRARYRDQFIARQMRLSENPPSVGGFAILRSTPEQIEETAKNLRFAAELPAIQDVVSGPDGSLWIQRTGVPSTVAGPIDVFSVGGVYQGTLSAQALPDAMGPNGLAAYISEGEYDEPVVTVHRLRLGR